MAERSKGTFLQARRGDRHYLALVGEIRHKISTTLDAYLERIFAAGSVAGLLVDLTEARAIDSTNLGLLARVAARMAREGGEPVTLVSPRPEINRVLEAMSLDRLFRVIREPWEREGDFRELERAEVDKYRFAEILLEAHRTIMELSPANRREFQALVETLSREMEPSSSRR